METNIQLDDCDGIENLAKSAAKIAFHNFKWHYVTLVLLNSAVSCGVSAFLQEYNKTAIVANVNLKPRYSEITKQFVLFGQKIDDVIYLIEWLEDHKFNYIGKFLIICQSNEFNDCDETEAVEMLWNHKITNVVFIKHKPNCGAIGYTYDFGHNCKNSPPTKLDNWENCIQNGDRCGDMFPIKLKNLYGCPLVVSTFIQVPYMDISDDDPSGADGDLLRILIEALNATLVIMTPQYGNGWGNLDENGTWVGSLGDLYYDLANFSMTSASITQSRNQDFQISNFYYTITLGWVTHPPELELPYYKLLRPFKVDTQIAFLVSFALVVITVLIFKTNICIYLYKKMKFGRIPDKVLFSSWEICMGQPISLFPANMSLCYLVLMWIWYCFLMRTFYQVHLINSLKTDIYSTQLLSIEQAIEAEYPFGGGAALKDYYINNSLVYDNWQHMESNQYYTIMLNLTEGMKFVLAMNLATAKVFLKQPGRKLHILPQKIINCPAVIFFKRFSPLVPPINRIIERLVEFGWVDVIFRNNTVTNNIERSEDVDKPIKLSNFTGCYVILLCGWTLSFVLLIIEKYYIKKQNRDSLYRN
ncbi:ionotropic receptor 25a-like [Vanessa cardui]|uniref:ionotropic receptor 25a-like n=1 Tax=Vanessa cardui TaxID=171605 RepID=UPI001F137E7E|nr:ionotropic receptor 25a-like [Vanessa cardui]